MIEAASGRGGRGQGVERHISTILERMRSLRPNPVVLIDGPSGAGKTTLAEALARAVPDSVLVHMDDLYLGWSGLEYGSRQLVKELLTPRAVGLPGRWQRYDWEAQRLAEWRWVAPQHPLIVEGCGALSQAGAGMADLRIWLSADDQMRKARALARSEGFDELWNAWEKQYTAFVARERPQRSADIVLEAGTG